ncbi:unnamed protein product [Effrenium voratum]|uniref:EF-hand domain-containing protein n=1 Tax=Effrenium voratum TaxID=2562239 RepID=A0AA36J818_9DINO|nr:unnamed protein product [Effrenium voratum]
MPEAAAGDQGPLPVPTDAEALQELRRALEKNQRQLLQRLNFQDEVLSLLLCKPRDAEDSETPLRSQVQHPPEPQHERESSKASPSFQDSVDVICEREQAIAVDEAMNMTQESRIMEVAVSMEKVGEAEPRIFRSITEQDARLKNLASQWELEDADDDDEEALRSNASQSDTVRRRTTRNSDFPKGWRGRLKVLVQSVPFEVFFAIGIIANAIFIGAEVEYFVNHPGPSPVAMEVVGQLFNVLFTVELSLRLVADGRTFFTDDKSWVWNWMDFVIVVSAITETSIQVVMALLYAASPPSGVESLSNLRVLRIVRITRLVRLTRIARITRFIKALRTLVTSIVFTLKSLVWALVLLFLIIYAFGIVFTQAAVMFLIEEELHAGVHADVLSDLELYWSNLYTSMLTLFMSISGGLSWELAIRPMQLVSPWCVMLLLFYIAFSYFAVLNVVTGVFCQSAIESAQSDHDMIMQNIIANKEAHIQKVRSLFTNLDADDSGYISLVELEENMHKKEVQTYFEALELDVHDAWTFFKLLDTDGGAAIEIEEFLFGCLRLRGPARALDMAKMQHEQGWMAKQLGAFMGYVEVTLKKLETGLLKAVEVQLETSLGPITDLQSPRLQSPRGDQLLSKPGKADIQRLNKPGRRVRGVRAEGASGGNSQRVDGGGNSQRVDGGGNSQRVDGGGNSQRVDGGDGRRHSRTHNSRQCTPAWSSDQG